MYNSNSLSFGKLPKETFVSADTETETEMDFAVSAKPKFGQNGRNSAESRNRICFGRTLFIEEPLKGSQNIKAIRYRIDWKMGVVALTTKISLKTYTIPRKLFFSSISAISDYQINFSDLYFTTSTTVSLIF